MKHKKWLYGIVTAVGVCLMATALLPVEIDAAGEEYHEYGQEVILEANKPDVIYEEKTENIAGGLHIPLSQAAEEKQDDMVVAETAETAETESPMLYYAKTAVRLREEPTTKSNIVAVLYRGEIVEFLEETGNNDWCLVRYNNSEGYLKQYHLESCNYENREDQYLSADDSSHLINKDMDKLSEKDNIEDSVISDEQSDSHNKSKEEWEYLGNYYITGYRMFSASENGGRSDGVTASGVVGTPGYTAAMKDIPFGTTIYVEGLGYYVVEDRGVGEECVDIACNTTGETYELTGYRDVYIVR